MHVTPQASGATNKVVTVTIAGMITGAVALVGLAFAASRHRRDTRDEAKGDLRMRHQPSCCVRVEGLAGLDRGTFAEWFARYQNDGPEAAAVEPTAPSPKSGPRAAKAIAE